MIQRFADLSQEQKNKIYSDSMVADIDEHLSFAIIEEEVVIGYALLRTKQIDLTWNIKPPIPFDVHQFACEIVIIKALDIERKACILSAIAKKVAGRIEMWYDDKEGHYRYLWSLYSDEGDANFYADLMDCEKAQCLFGMDTLKYLNYKDLLDNFTE